jgi:acyl dehydratase
MQVGDQLPTFTTQPITGLTLALFAGGSGDHNPIHVDRDFAQRYGFEDVFAHGMLSMAFLGRLLTNWAPIERIKSYGVRFASITPFRSEVECRGVVREIVEQDGRRVALLDLSTVLKDGTVTLTGDAAVWLD